MKTLLLGALAATLVAVPLATAAEAAPQHRTVTTVRERPDGTVVTRQRTTERRWAPGQRFDRRHARNYRVVADWRAQRLAAPGRGQRWVRSAATPC